MTADLPVLGPRDNVDRPAQWPLVSHKVLGVGAVSDYVDDTVATPDVGMPPQVSGTSGW